MIAASMEAVASAAAGGQLAAATVMENNKRKEDHRQLPRSSRRKFRHDLALECIERDYIGDTPLLGVEFKLMFRLSQGRFQVLMEDVMASDIKFFKLTGRDGRNKIYGFGRPPTRGLAGFGPLGGCLVTGRAWR
jgi:hypothetical protein